MNTHVDSRRIVIFVAFAFGIAWATALAIYLTGGLVDSPDLIPGLPGFTLATMLMALPIGVIASIPMTMFALWVLFSPNALTPTEEMELVRDTDGTEPDLVTKPA